MALMQPGTQQEGDRAAGARNLPNPSIITKRGKTADMISISCAGTCGEEDFKCS